MSTDSISSLRQRMIEDMSARKLRAGTQRGHIGPNSQDGRQLLQRPVFGFGGVRTCPRRDTGSCRQSRGIRDSQATIRAKKLAYDDSP